MERVIDALAAGFGVSRQAAKLRLVELGFDEAIGTYTYLDGHYVKPHGFKKGSIQPNQTFSLSAQDAAIARAWSEEFQTLTANGDYLFIDHHFVYRTSLYVMRDENGRLALTDYARTHMDECCLVFDMTIIGGVIPEYHTACFLNRWAKNYSIDFQFHRGYENSTPERQVALRMKQREEENEIRKRMTDDPEQCMQLLLQWRDQSYTDLADAAGLNLKTILRTVKGQSRPTLTNVVRICFCLHLPPVISTKLLEVFGYHICSTTNLEEQWIQEALQVKYMDSLKEVQKYLEPYGVKI